MNPRIEAAARAICKLASKECGLPEAENWQLNSDLFVKDARAALKAADKAAQAEGDLSLMREILTLRESVKFYREKYGVTAC